MKTKAFLILSVLPTFTLSGCDTAQQILLGMPKPTARLSGVRFGEIDLQSAALLFDVEVSNPYPAALPLLNMDYSVTSGQSRLFEGKADLQTTIPAKGSRSVSLPIKIRYTDLLNVLADLKNVRPGSAIPYSADVGLSVDTETFGPLRLPLKKSGNLTLPELPRATDWKDILNRTLTP